MDTFFTVLPDLCAGHNSFLPLRALMLRDVIGLSQKFLEHFKVRLCPNHKPDKEKDDGPRKFFRQ